jgi:hypothetical protein
MLALVLALPALVVPHKEAAAPAVAPALRLRGGLALETSTLNLAGCLYHASFGAALYADPEAFTDSGFSPVKYTADTEGPVGSFTGRAFGAMMRARSHRSHRAAPRRSPRAARSRRLPPQMARRARARLAPSTRVTRRAQSACLRSTCGRRSPSPSPR